MLTAEQIAKRAENFCGVGERRVINKLYRKQENSVAIEKAIRAVNRFERANGAIGGLEYCYALEGELSRIVNSHY